MYEEPDPAQPAEYDAARQARLDGHDYEQPGPGPYDTLEPLHGQYEPAAVAAARPGSASGYETLGPEHAREPAAGGGGYEAYSAAEIAAAVAAQAGKDAARPYAALAGPHAVYGGTGGIGDTAV